jgi:hypothetical protein
MKQGLLAQAIPLGKLNEGPGLGPFGNIDLSNPLVQVAKVISLIIGFITIVAGIFFMIQLMIGGIEWISSTGDKTKLQKAQDRITNAILGLIVVAAAYAITGLVGTLLGLDIFLQQGSPLEGILK